MGTSFWKRIALFAAVMMFATPFASANEDSLKVLTFNTWLLDIPVYPFGFRKDLSLEMNQRLSIMPTKLAETGADVIVLEEVWSQSSKDELIQGMRKLGYPYAVYTKSSNWAFLFQTAMGDGLLILSKYPVSDHVLHHDFTKPTQSNESFASKGVIKVAMKHPTQGWIDLYASHLGAVEFKDGTYVKAQSVLHDEQMKELAEFIRQTRTSPITILAADLNLHYQRWSEETHSFTQEYSESYTELKKSACGYGQILNDTYLQANQKTVKSAPDFTFDQKNPYANNGYYQALPSEVEDYIFVCDNTLMAIQNSALVFKNPAHESPLSDHYGVLTTFHGYAESPLHLSSSF